MKTIFIALFTLISTVTIAQNTVTWKGGTPGNETSWNEARNWSNHKVPNEFSNVIIPDVSSSTFSYPIIEEGIVELNSILVASTALLTIRNSAKLIIYGYAEGLTIDKPEPVKSPIAFAGHASTEVPSPSRSSYK